MAIIRTGSSKGKKLGFKVSSHLKSVIGRDLITDDYVAIFELVKNSFDAGAKRVDLFFKDNSIVIKDNGKGMTLDDLRDKWLFVAYSAKSDGTEDSAAKEPATRRSTAPAQYAGSKGVGRFSCDRLGRKLFLQTRKKYTGTEVHTLEIDWALFEASSKKEFVKIPVVYKRAQDFVVDGKVDARLRGGTILTISELRDSWDRDKLLNLKASLAKLISPFGSSKDGFEVYLHAENEIGGDEKALRKYADEEGVARRIVNGKIENFIFQALQERTTWLRTWVDKKAKKIFTELIDRGSLIYRISEPLEYSQLLDSKFECNLFYLNRASKLTFKKRMGVPAVQFGSVFLFKNGFRVYPVGEEADDTFGIDRRKQQGYARYLGTRDVLGRIDVYGDEKKFRESSSRDKGLIETAAYKELVDCFKKKCLFRLENYVVGVSWKLKYDADMEDSTFLAGDDAKARVIEVLSKLVSSENIVIHSYAADLLHIANSKLDDFERTAESLTSLALRIGDKALIRQVKSTVTKYEEMRKAEEEALAYAEKEREARKRAEEKADKAEKSYEEEKSRSLFLTSLQSRDKEILENLHHQVIIYASNAIQHIEASLIEIRMGKKVSIADVQKTFEELLLINKQVIAASRFATTANFKIESSAISANLVSYLSEYIGKISPIYERRISVSASSSSKSFTMKFRPIEMTIIIDNLVDNAFKAGATKIDFDMAVAHGKYLEIYARDNGFGIDSSISEKESIFDKGITTTHGSGLGLYHVRQLLEGMHGTIALEKSDASGTDFLIRIYK